jgi:hypothetical protein
MPLGIFRLNGLGKRRSIPRTASTISGSRPGTTSAIFGNGINFQNDANYDPEYFTLTLPSSVGNSNLTIEFWHYWDQGSAGGTTEPFNFSNLTLQTSANDGNRLINLSTFTVLKSGVGVKDAWRHICLQTTGNGTWYAWSGGSNLGTFSFNETANSMRFGKQVGAFLSSTFYHQHIFDEIRISKVLRYTNGQNLTVPTSAFTNDSDTLALFHCNSTTETDDIS